MIRIIFMVFFVLLLNLPCQEQTARQVFDVLKNVEGVELDHEDIDTVNLILPVIAPGGPGWPGACYHLFHGFRNKDVLGDVQPELTHCGVKKPNVQKRFIEGAQTRHEAHPWMVVIKAKNVQKQVIRVTSGIIIHRRFILASTYGIPDEAVDLAIIIGGARINDDGHIIKRPGAIIKEIAKEGAVYYMPPNEPHGHEHRGLALIDLRNARIQIYDDFVKPACIPAFRVPVPPNEQTCLFHHNEVVTVAGFGNTLDFYYYDKLNKQQMIFQELTQLYQAVLLTSNQPNGGATRGDYGAPIEVNRNLADPEQPQQNDVRKFALALITYVHPPEQNVPDPDVIAISLIEAAPWITRTIQQIL